MVMLGLLAISSVTSDSNRDPLPALTYNTLRQRIIGSSRSTIANWWGYSVRKINGATLFETYNPIVIVKFHFPAGGRLYDCKMIKFK